MTSVSIALAEKVKNPIVVIATTIATLKESDFSRA
jgi:hypothetical protein